ncbi:MAG TPA: diguanylate cyclase response regulator [Elusimicrobia bacterium]|nr:diguanylate cyclase response regulator [Elusimicrobiota bacterium]
MAHARLPRPRILLADDEPDLLALMKETLERQGFDVDTALDGNEALAAIRKSPPDIAVLDLIMPRCDGFTVCRELRKDPLFAHMPIIILSASGSRDSKVEGLDLGVDDFITKSVDIRELLARIRMILKRSRQGLDANPLTRLPGNLSIDSRIDEALAASRPLAVLYVDLDQFKAYNDAYGYEAGDHVIKTLANILIKATRQVQGPPDFVGHIGVDDFIVLTDPSRMEDIAGRIIAEFDAAVPAFYKESDRQSGRLVSTDRQGNIREFPLLSVSIGICHNAYRRLESLAQVSQLGAELKKHAKEQAGSKYIVDRRKD